MQPVRPKPLGVTILGVLMILAGLFDIVGSGLGRNADPFEAGLGYFGVLLGLLFLATGVGFLQGSKWAWTPGLILAFLNLVRILVVGSQSGYAVALPGIIVALIIIYYILTPRVQDYFGVGIKPRSQ